MEITIKDKIIKLKYGFKAMMIYERIEDKAFAPSSMSDVIMFFYSCILAANADVLFDDFIDWLDENPEKVTEFSNFLTTSIESKTLKKVLEKENK